MVRHRPNKHHAAQIEIAAMRLPALALACLAASAASAAAFTAAAVQHQVITGANDEDTIKQNLAMYGVHASDAASKGAQVCKKTLISVPMVLGRLATPAAIPSSPCADLHFYDGCERIPLSDPWACTCAPVVWALRAT